MGGCTVILERDLNEKILNKKIEEMLKMSRKQEKSITENADEKIFRMIQPFLEK